jgi:hypothetical protein
VRAAGCAVEAICAICQRSMRPPRWAVAGDARRMIPMDGRIDAIPPQHKPLVEQLAKLPESERRAVIAAAEAAAKTRGATIPWEELAAARGIVRLGGDAVEDCDRLYDE